ncbi:MAG TPA: membrane dipeptidase [Candidatus Dormibacteraeota bacterium]
MPDHSTPIVDAHLDLAYNARSGRDLELTVAEVRAREHATEEQCMVTLPELRRGGVAIAFASIYVRPQHAYQDVDPVFDQATWAEGRSQLDVYRRWEDAGLVRIIRDRGSLRDHLAAWRSDSLPGLLIGIEGAEPIRDPDELPDWFGLGVRAIGPAWGPSRYSGGFASGWGRETGFTDMGRELVAGMMELGMLLDLAHGSATGWHEGIEIATGFVACTHTSPREVVQMERMPDANLMRALAAAGGVVGLGLGNVFLDRGWWGDGSRAPVHLQRAAELLAMMAAAAGWDRVGIGSDLDGGMGLEESPVELQSIADERLLGDLVPSAAAGGVLGGNWIALLERVLP